MLLEAGIDLLYVDGPPVSWSPPVNLDALDHLDKGGRPRTIMIDVRLATVDAIHAARAAADYSFTPGLRWAMESPRAGGGSVSRFLERTIGTPFSRAG